MASPPATATPDTERRRRYASVAQAAEYLAVTQRTIRAMIADGRITGYRIGQRRIRVDLNDIDDFLTTIGGAS